MAGLSHGKGKTALLRPGLRQSSRKLERSWGRDDALQGIIEAKRGLERLKTACRGIGFTNAYVCVRVLMLID